MSDLSSSTSNSSINKVKVAVANAKKWYVMEKEDGLKVYKSNGKPATGKNNTELDNISKILLGTSDDCVTVS